MVISLFKAIWWRHSKSSKPRWEMQADHIVNKISRYLRRLHLSLDSQEVFLKRIDERLSLLVTQHKAEESHVNQNTVSIPTMDVIACLDHLDKAHRHLQSDHLTLELIEETIDTLQRKSGLVPTTTLGQPPTQHYEIVATSNLSEKQEGTVTEIIRQGYTKIDGTVIRNALIVTNNVINKASKDTENFENKGARNETKESVWY